MKNHRSRNSGSVFSSENRTKQIEDNKASQLVDLAVGNGYEPTQKEKVEPMTLKALYRERVEAGLDMPSDFFHLYVKDETKMKR